MTHKSEVGVVLGKKESKTPPKTRLTWQRFLVILFALGVMLAFAFFQCEVPRGLGLVSVFLVNLMGSGTIVLPVPAILTVILAARPGGLDPLQVGLVAGVASAIGELSGYMLGYGGGVLIDENPVYQRFYNFMKRFGFWTILVLAIIPNPLFDMAGMAAGALRFPVSRFFIAALIGKTTRMMIVAYASFFGFQILLNLFGGDISALNCS